MRQFAVIIGLLLTMTLVGTLGIHELTDYDWLESAYVALVTLTTVGSRDVPHEPRIMLFVMAYLIGGLGVFTYSAFQLGQIVMNANLTRVLERRRMERELDQLHGHFIVCGLGRMGTSICETLARGKQRFVAVDSSREVVERVCRPRHWPYVEGDASDDAVLDRAGISHARGLATVLPSDAGNLYVVLSARLLSPKLPIIARANDVAAIEKLKRTGATRVISPYSSGAAKMARTLVSPNLEDFLEITDQEGRHLELVELEISPDSPYVNQELSQIDLKSQGIVIIGVRRPNREYVLAPPSSQRIGAGDSLIAFGNAEALNVILKKASPS